MQNPQQPFKFSWFDHFCLWYPPGWLILFNRHWQHYHENPQGWNGLEYILFLFPGGFYLALLLRWLRLGCRIPKTPEVEVNPNYQKAFRDEILAPIVESYFQAELHGINHLPQTQPLIIAMNHAGMSFPWDFLCLGYLLSKERDWFVQPLAGISLFEHPWVRWWLPPGWSQVLGGVKADAEALKAAVEKGTVLLYAPEGLQGPRKGWTKRYQLQTFHPSFVSLSLRYQVPILPVVCLGNEFLHPWAKNSKFLAQRLKMPFFPLSLGILGFILFPSLGVWGVKTRLRYYIQPLYKPEIKEGKLLRSHLYQEAQKLRDQLQSVIRHLISEDESSLTNR